MSFPSYPEYKDSGVEWLGEVPGHWGVKKIGHIADLIAGFAFPSDRFEFDPESGIPLVRGDNVTEGWLRWGEKGRYWPRSAEYDPRYLLARDDILVQMDGSKVGKNWAIVGEGDLPALLVQRVTRIRANGALSKFVYSFIANEMFIRYVDRAKTDPAIPHITMKDIADYWITLPPLPEQTQIAAFLDRETAKIDALVAEQRRLMALLKEKRQAVISHAVTRGLNPHAPLKPSGIEWLGDVPEHWDVLPAKRVSSVFVPQRNKPELNAEGEGHFWVTMEQMRSAEINSAELSVTESAARDAGTRILQAGAVIASCVGTFGLAAINNINVIINQQLQAYIPTDLVDAKFMRHCVVIAEGYFEQIGTAATIAYVNQLGFANMSMVLPPKAEQNQIVEFLEVESAKFDALTTEAQRAIDLLQERRTALISAAVTGQIDVRNLVASA